MPDKTWFTMRRDGRKARLDIFDEIGYFGIRASLFIADLRGLGEVDEIELHINSPGGEVFDALAIYNNLRSHKATVTVMIDGLAASAASLIAMAGDKVVMPENAMMMIHNPMGITLGDADAMRDMADVLDKITLSLASAYVAKSGQNEKAVRKIMSEDTWLTAKECVDLGFADEMEPAMKIAALFDLSRYRDAPEEFHASRHPAGFFNAKENHMPKANPAGSSAADVTADEEKAKIEAKAAADKKAAEEEDEKKKKDEEAKKAAAAKKSESPDEDEDEDKKAAAARADASAIVELCADAGVPKLAAALVKEGATLDTAKQRIEAAGEIRGIVATARKINPAIDAKFADDLISAGASSEHARAQLFDKIVSMQSPDIAGRHTANGGGNPGHVPAGNNGWDAATAKAAAQLGIKSQ